MRSSTPTTAVESADRPSSADPSAAAETGTRDAVVRLLLESSPLTAADLAERLGVSAAAIRRHLDGLLDRGLACEAPARRAARTGRGRPPKTYALTDAGRAEFPHAYDDLAGAALRYLEASGGPGALEAFACFRTGELERSLSEEMAGDSAADPSAAESQLLADALSRHGYAASVQRVAGGVQVCQHHCPISNIAQQYGQLCESETRMFERLLGTHVQRLATLAHGDGVCTTFVPDPRPIQLIPLASPARAADPQTDPTQIDPAQIDPARPDITATHVRPGGTS
jgi:predicted ArsR family transcriptional regulator